MKRAVLVVLVGGCSGMYHATADVERHGAEGEGRGAPSAGEPVCWADMLTASMRNRQAGIEGIFLIIRATSW